MRSFPHHGGFKMADNSGGIGLMGVLIGAIIVIGVGFFFYRGMAGDTGGTNIKIEAPAVPVVPK
jgi:hypothetical protein